MTVSKPSVSCPKCGSDQVAAKAYPERWPERAADRAWRCRACRHEFGARVVPEPLMPDFGTLDGRPIRLDDSVWSLPEEERARIQVVQTFADGSRCSVRPFR